MRLFVALDVPQRVLVTLSELIKNLKKTCQSARWVRLEGVHITLKFIGEIPDDSLEGIGEALGTIPSFPPLEVRFAGLGFFPGPHRPRVFWAGVEGGPDLAQLATAIEMRLEPLGISAEKRAFHPHLTLARFASPQGTQELRERVEMLGTPEFGKELFREFHLYRSVLKRSGAEYTRLFTYSIWREFSS